MISPLTKSVTVPKTRLLIPSLSGPPPKMNGYKKDDDNVVHVEILDNDLERVVTDDSLTNVDTDFSPAEQRSIIRRIDRRLVLVTGLMYCVSLMDRTNLGV